MLCGNYILSNRSEWTFYFLSSVQFNFTIGDFNFNNKILKLLIRKEWYERNNKNFTLILKLSINNEKNL